VKYQGIIEITPDGFKTISRIPVISSNVASIGYDESSYTLTVEFHKGKFLHKEIKGIYEYSSDN